MRKIKANKNMLYVVSEEANSEHVDEFGLFYEDIVDEDSWFIYSCGIAGR